MPTHWKQIQSHTESYYRLFVRCMLCSVAVLSNGNLTSVTHLHIRVPIGRYDGYHHGVFHRMSSPVRISRTFLVTVAIWHAVTMLSWKTNRSICILVSHASLIYTYANLGWAGVFIFNSMHTTFVYNSFNFPFLFLFSSISIIHFHVLFVALSFSLAFEDDCGRYDVYFCI